MKKLLGLLLNCFALCLCSAIGIGAGMYWMQQERQSTPPESTIQQLQGSIEAVPQTPNRISPPASSQAINNLSKKSSSSNIQPIAFFDDGATFDSTKDYIEVSGTGNSDIKTNETGDTPQEIFMSFQDLANLKFTLKREANPTFVIKDAIAIVEGSTTPIVLKNETSTTETQLTFAKLTNELNILRPENQFKVEIKVGSNNSDDSDQTFKFLVKEELAIEKVEITKPGVSGTLIEINDTNKKDFQHSGPEAKIKVTIQRKSDEEYSLYLKSLNRKEVQNLTETNECTITQSGEYELYVTRENSSIKYRSFEFTIVPPKNFSAKSQIESIEDETLTPHVNYILHDLPDGYSPLNLFGTKMNCTIKGTNDRLVRLKYSKNGPQGDYEIFPGQAVAITSDKAIFSNLILEPGTYHLQAEDAWYPNNKAPASASSEIKTVIVPDQIGQQLDKPVIVSYQNHLYASRQPYPGPSSPIEIFGNYLELFGTDLVEQSSPEFFMFMNNNQGSLVPVPQEKLKANWKSQAPWHVKLELDVAEENERILFLRTQQKGYYAMSKPIKLSFKVLNKDSLKTPEIPSDLIVDREDNSSNSTTEYNINKSQFSIKFPDSLGSTLQNAQALFYTTNSSELIAYCNYAATKEATLSKPLSNGTHQIYMKLAQGDFVSEVKSNPITVNIQTTPLKVKETKPENFGVGGNAPEFQELRITFPETNPLKIPPKEDTEPYKSFVNSFYLIPQNRDGNFLFGNKIYATEEDAGKAETRKLSFFSDTNSIVLSFKNLPTNNYQLVIEGQHVVDKFGNQLTGVDGGEPGSTYRKVLSESKSSGTPPVETPTPETPKEETPSVPAQLELGEFVKYHEYEKRPSESGFNPSDKVVTRVARLYYYRDAHRVAQILNSEVQSMNHTGYHEAQIKAQQTRKAYEGAVFDRQKQEQKAIAAAKELRGIENQYRTQQQTVSALIRRRARLESETATEARPQSTIDAEKTSLEGQITQAQGVLSDLRADITTKSTTMNTADQSLKELELKESQLSANLFRDEVKAEKTDLYSIAKGVPCSYDAVQQVTIKVIGEGLIHLRGPIKGVNIVRTMINQIDSPVGQVRIAMHTIQINGEDGKRMEIVADSIQKSIDQSRFLTVQSSQMLRKAIVAVASEVAVSSCPGEFGYTQEQRDEKYLYAFFGQDFIEALREMDSEFLQSGNKLLSIHSMDTTSLASALFVLALAKNEIRQQILARFYASLETELPEDELQFLYQGGPTKANKPKHVHLLAPYAHFQSFKGFFDHEVIGTDTMTPIQREFVRLAQIFKARLTTERELNLHVMERAVIEQRGDDYEAELDAAREREEQAQCKLAEVQKSLEQSQFSVVKATTSLQAQFRVIAEQNQKTAEETKVTAEPFYTFIEETLIELAKNETSLRGINFNKLSTEQRKEFLMELFPEQNPEQDDFLSRFEKLVNKYFGNTLNKKQREKLLGTYRVFSLNLQGQKFAFQLERTGNSPNDTPILQPKLVKPESSESDIYLAEKQKELEKIFAGYLSTINQIKSFYSVFNLDDDLKSKVELIDQYLYWINHTEGNYVIKLQRIAVIFILLEEIGNEANKEAKSILEGLRKVSVSLQITELDPKEIQETFTLWKQARTQALNFLKPETKQHAEMLKIVSSVDAAFDSLLETSLRFKFAQQNALDSRLALDHRKFLDMNIDQTEDRLIELIEGTRAHTANIDNYLKRIATALEDDFNTQFYYPAFKEARDASRYWNVSFGSMETSTILTNNRSLGKVAPKATIEFDLPKRQLAIIEGMNIADAAFQEYGALVNDPTFLAISSMNGGKRVAGGYATESDTIEKQVLGQSDSRDFKFGSAFENLIPDPAIFKFETGTGFTVRPVIQPDGQAVVFDLNYLYRTNIREPVRPDEKHLGRVKEHFINTDVQLGNYELREVSRFMIALKASRTANGVPLLADVPGVGVLFRPTPSSESSLQQSQIMSQAVIFPTLFDLMGLRWAPAVADVGPLQLSNREFISKGRDRFLKNRVYDYAGSQVDQFLQIPESERRSDLYRTQQTIPDVHPNGYMGQGLNMKRSQLQENFHPEQQNPAERFIPESNMQERIDTNRAIPVLPNIPQLPSVPPAAEGPTSSTRPIRDSGLKPASWSPTSEASKAGNQDLKGGSWISSPRRITKTQNQQTQSQTQTQTVKPAPVRQAAPTPRKIQPAKPESPGFYKRSVSRFKSLFNDD